MAKDGDGRIIGWFEARRIRAEREAILWHALKSDNPAVSTALESLLVLTKLAHGEEVGEDIYVKQVTRSGWQRLSAEVEKRARKEERSLMRDEMHRATMVGARNALIWMVAMSIMTIYAFTRGG